MSASASASASTQSLRSPLIAIVGATGTGKSQLAVALAERYNGEIINGDALQMYEGLPVATNKISFEGRRSIPHHLLGCVKLEDEPWSVGKFKDQAIKTIESIRSRGKLPILVGGTHYYTQSLLFKDSTVEDKNEDSENRPPKPLHTWPTLAASTDEMLVELKKVDPVMAARWHPNDRRKIQRSLEIWYVTGRRASSLYEEQRTRRSAVTCVQDGDEGVFGKDEHNNTTHHLVSPLRYDSLILWTHSSSEELKSRLDKRVDGMLSDGLLPEVASMIALSRNLQSERRAEAAGQGIWVAIGYKELVPYFKALDLKNNRPQDLKRLEEECVTQIKAHSRQYAKRQVRWIRLKLMHALQYSSLSRTLFLLDGSDLSRWAIEVEGQASDLVAAFLRDEPLPEPASLSEAAEVMLQPSRKEEMFARYCKACTKTLMSEKEWDRHVNGKRHQREQKYEGKRGRSTTADILE